MAVRTIISDPQIHRPPLMVSGWYRLGARAERPAATMRRQTHRPSDGTDSGPSEGHTKLRKVAGQRFDGRQHACDDAARCIFNGDPVQGGASRKLTPVQQEEQRANGTYAAPFAEKPSFSHVTDARSGMCWGRLCDTHPAIEPTALAVKSCTTLSSEGSRCAANRATRPRK